MHRKLTKRGTRKSDGFTLTEVIVAITLLVLGVIPVLKALTGSYVASKRIDYKTNSLFLAQEKIEDIRVMSINNYSTDFSENNTTLGNSYLCDVSDSSVGSDLRDIVVTVGYDVNGDNSLDPDEELISLRTMIARRV